MRTSAKSLAATICLTLVVAACGGEPPSSASTSSSSTSTSSTTTTTQATATTSGAEPTTTTPNLEVGDLLVVGNWGSGTMPQGAVAGAMWSYAEVNDVVAILTTGDNFYSDDFEFIMEPYGWADDLGIPWWITWGDHDVETPARSQGIDQAFDDPAPWTVHEWGAVDVVILDSTQVESEEQADFLTQSLAASTRPTIVVFHHPRYSCATATTEDVDSWVSAFDDDVVLVLSGHEESYQRFEEGAVSYVVTGGGGAALTELLPCPSGDPPLIAGESVHHFLALSQGEDGLTVTAVDINGRSIDQFQVALP